MSNGWNVRLAILMSTLMGVIGMDLFAASKGVNSLPISVGDIVALLGGVLASSAVTRGQKGPPGAV